MFATKPVAFITHSLTTLSLFPRLCFYLLMLTLQKENKNKKKETEKEFISEI